MHVRRIELGDVHRYKRVRLAALADTPSAFGSTYAREAVLTDEEWLQRTSSTASGHERAIFFAVDDADEILGLAGGFETGPGELHLISMWTAPAARRQGAARALVQAVLDFAGDRNVTLFVTIGNDAAHALYESLGFVDTDLVQPVDPDDPTRLEVLMQLAR